MHKFLLFLKSCIILHAPQKYGGRLRKGSEEAVHDKMQWVKNLEIHFVELHTFGFASSVEDTRKVRGRLIFVKGRWMAHAVQPEPNHIQGLHCTIPS